MPPVTRFFMEKEEVYHPLTCVASPQVKIKINTPFEIVLCTVTVVSVHPFLRFLVGWSVWFYQPFTVRKC